MSRFTAACLAAACAFLPGAAPAEQMPGWTPPANGLRSRLVADRDTCREGEQLFFYLDVFNDAAEPVPIIFGSVLREHLRIEDAEGNVLQPRPRPDEAGKWARPLAPHKQAQVNGFYASGNQYAAWDPLKPGKYVAKWEPPAQADPAGRFPPACSAAFSVVPGPIPPAAPPPKPIDVSWGEAAGGLRTRIRAHCASFAAGRPVPIVVEIENVAKEVLRYHDPQVAINGRIEVKDAAGRPVPYIGGSAQTINNEHPLKPGDRAALDSVDLAEYYLLLKPGRYSARWPGAKAWNIRDDGWGNAVPPDSDIPPTNTFRFEIVPAPADAFADAVIALQDNLPADYSLAVHKPLARLVRPGAQWGRVPGRSLGIEYTGPRQNEKRVMPFRLYFANEKAAVEPWDLALESELRKSSFLGKSASGFIYLEAADHPSAWPTAGADFGKWLKTGREE